MVNLRRNKKILILITLCISGCVSPSVYHANKENSLGTDIVVSPDRVIVECEFIADYEGDYKNPYGFMIHILDMERTVLTVSNGTVLEKEDCFERLKAAEKIIREAKSVFVRGRGDAESPIEMHKSTKYFPGHGNFHWNGRALNFLAIWNDKGQCYDAFHHGKEECQR